MALQDVLCTELLKLGVRTLYFITNRKRLKFYYRKTCTVIDNKIKTFLDKQFTVDSGTTSEKQKTLHYSLPYIGHFSYVTKRKLRHICERFCKDIDINNGFSLLKLSSFFTCKDTLPKSHQFYVVYQLACAGCKACYIGETI